MSFTNVINSTQTINPTSISNPIVLTDGTLVVAFLHTITPLVVTTNRYQLYVATSTDSGRTWTNTNTGLTADSALVTPQYSPIRLVAGNQNSWWLVWDRYTAGVRSLYVYHNPTSTITLNLIGTRTTLVVASETYTASTSDIVGQGKLVVALDIDNRLHIVEAHTTPRYLRLSLSGWELESRINSVSIDNNNLSLTIDPIAQVIRLFGYHTASNQLVHLTLALNYPTIPIVASGAFLGNLFTTQTSPGNLLAGAIVAGIRAFCIDSVLRVGVFYSSDGTRRFQLFTYDAAWSSDLIELNYPNLAIPTANTSDIQIWHTHETGFPTLLTRLKDSVGMHSTVASYNKNCYDYLGVVISNHNLFTGLNLFYSEEIYDLNLLSTPQSNPNSLEITTVSGDLIVEYGVYVDIDLQVQGSLGLVYWSLTSGTLPGGLVLDSYTGKVTGVPVLVGSSVITLQAQDHANNIISKNLTWTVNPLACEIFDRPLASATNGSPYSVYLASRDTGLVKTYSLTAGTLPAGLTLASDGELAGTPTVVGSYSFTVEVDDGNTSNDGVFTIEVAASVIGSITTNNIDFGSVSVGLPFSYNMLSTGLTPPLVWGSDNPDLLPVGLFLDSTGLFSGPATQADSYSWTVYVVDSNNVCVEKSFSLTVDPANIAIATLVLPDGVQAQYYSQKLSQTSTGLPDADWQLSQGLLTNGMQLLTNGVIAGTSVIPNSSDFEVLATDSSSSDTQALSLTITGSPITINRPKNRAVVGRTYLSDLTFQGGSGSYVFVEKRVTERVTVDSTILASKNHTFALIPVSATDVQMRIVGGVSQFWGKDFTVLSDNSGVDRVVDWNFTNPLIAVGIDHLIVGDVLEWTYHTYLAIAIDPDGTTNLAEQEIVVETTVADLTIVTNKNYELMELPVSEVQFLVNTNYCTLDVDFVLTSNGFDNRLISWDSADVTPGINTIVVGDQLTWIYTKEINNILTTNGASVFTDRLVVETIPIDLTIETNKSMNLKTEPKQPELTTLELNGGGFQRYTQDFAVIDDGSGDIRKLTWDSAEVNIGIDNLQIQNGDWIQVTYPFEYYELDVNSVVWSEIPYGFGFYDHLPHGLTLASEGRLSGVPTNEGTYTFRLQVIDSDGVIKQQVFKIAVEPSNSILDLTSTGSGDGVSATDISSTLDKYSGVISDITLHWVGGSVRIDYTLTTTTNNTDSTLDSPGLVQYCLVPMSETPQETDWIDLPLFATSQVSSITGSTIGADHNIAFESLYAPILGIIETLELVVDFRVRMAIGDSTSVVNGVVTQASNYVVSAPIKLSNKLSQYSRARKARAIADGLLSI